MLKVSNSQHHGEHYYGCPHSVLVHPGQVKGILLEFWEEKVLWRWKKLCADGQECGCVLIQSALKHLIENDVLRQIYYALSILEYIGSFGIKSLILWQTHNTLSSLNSFDQCGLATQYRPCERFIDIRNVCINALHQYLCGALDSEEIDTLKTIFSNISICFFCKGIITPYKRLFEPILCKLLIDDDPNNLVHNSPYNKKEVKRAMNEAERQGSLPIYSSYAFDSM